MLVKAVNGIKVPMENKPRSYITEAEAVDVPETAYYRRRLRDGNLVVAKGTARKAPEGGK